MKYKYNACFAILPMNKSLCVTNLCADTNTQDGNSQIYICN